MSARLALLVALLFAGWDPAPPAGQIALQIDTDAIVTPPGRPSLFDALRVDVYPPGQEAPCADCSRTFGVTSDQFKRGQVTFGIPLPPDQSGWRARVRLYPARATLTGEAPPSTESGPPASVIDVTVALPATAPDGLLERRVRLFTETVGGPVDATTEPGRFERSLVDTSEPATPVPCAGEPLDGEVCIPGGAFFMGNAKAAYNYDGSSQLGTDRLRLVVLSPYFFDADLVTVGRLRAAGLSAEITRSVDADGSKQNDYCTFTADPGALESYPVTCVSRATASRYCELRGARLPTEAEFEFAASAFEGRLFVWGDDPMRDCEDAVIARTGHGPYANATSFCEAMLPSFGGSQPVGGSLPEPRRDHLRLADGSVVHDLVGNGFQLMLDRWNTQSEACWNHGGVFFDPHCDDPSTSRYAARGTPFYGTYPQPAAAHYRYTIGTEIFPGFAFRCARSAR